MKKILSVFLFIQLIVFYIKGEEKMSFTYHVDKFADIEVLRYKVEGFEFLSLQQKKYIYYLSEAALVGRDILFDQNYRYNLLIRETLESIYLGYQGNRETADFLSFETYLKRVWFSNGIHHHYSTKKIKAEFTPAYFSKLLLAIQPEDLPLSEKIPTSTDLFNFLSPFIFDETVDSLRISLDMSEDVIAHSANNYYKGNISQQEVEEFYALKKASQIENPPSFGLNSQLEKRENILVENTWKLGGMYSAAIEKIIFYLEKAKSVAENEQQKTYISLLIDYYTTGDLKTFDAYSIAWLQDTDSQIDFINGFIETYGDALGIKASWEALVNYKDELASQKTALISEYAQWFEDHSPIDARFKKEEVKGVSAKVIHAAMLGGDCYPATPIGINLPNSDWIRKEYGSKSVSIQNITEAYHQVAKENGMLDEFVWSEKEKNIIEKYNSQTTNLHVDLHECLGHGSGKLLPEVDPDALKSYGATIEETRADLFSLYYLPDKKMVDLALLPNEEAYQAEYYQYMMNGLLTQLVRIDLGEEVQESHMRNRQLIAKWVLEKGEQNKVVELKKRDGKTYVCVNDYAALRQLFADLLKEIQRIKSEGDFEAAKYLVETYAVKIDFSLHKEVLERYEKLQIAPYKGFVNPRYIPVLNKQGEILDIKVDYTESYVEQMQRYSKEYSFLEPSF